MPVAQLLESLTLELALSTFDLGAMVKSIVDGVPSFDRERVVYQGAHPLAVLGDEARLRFAVANLLAMTLDCSLHSTSINVSAFQRGRRAEIWIEAVGRPRKQHAMAVEILCRVVQAHGGHVATTVSDDAFSIRLDVPAFRAPYRFPDRASILLVDDNVAQLTALTEVLRHHGLAIDSATSGHQAIAQIAAKTPDLLVIDVALPDVNGIEVIRQARHHKPDLRVALLTGYPQDHPMIARVIATPHTRYIAKPVELDTLLETVATALQ